MYAAGPEYKLAAGHILRSQFRVTPRESNFIAPGIF